ncbi:queuosine precursor transporter [Mesorhizobium koreense]|uniref:queuosine precursor transporter n=1 Tax=Mesorhizobium koreense TaxID=3074855 RepID=UPI00287B8CA4|nr:queuosine precursor transporter [Mesorhizobium sp. WR6]
MTLRRELLPFALAMAAVVTASNILVQYPFDHLGLGEILTWGAFSYPVAFLVNDLTNRRYGKPAARRVVLAGFIVGALFSVWLATPRIAIASGTAFLIGQLLDITVFGRLRRQAWWRAPLAATMCGSLIDTAIFFSLAFAAPFAFLDTGFGLADGSLAFPSELFGGQAPLWMTLALGDLSVKIIMGLLMLVPYGALLNVLKPVPALAR